MRGKNTKLIGPNLIVHVIILICVYVRTKHTAMTVFLKIRTQVCALGVRFELHVIELIRPCKGFTVYTCPQIPPWINPLNHTSRKLPVSDLKPTAGSAQPRKVQTYESDSQLFWPSKKTIGC